MAVRRKFLAVGAGAAVAAAVAAAAVGVQVTVSDVAVSSISGSSSFRVIDGVCDANVTFNNGTVESIDGGLIYTWDYDIVTPADGVACTALEVQAVSSNGDSVGRAVPAEYSPRQGPNVDRAILNPATRTGQMTVATNPNFAADDFDRLNVIGIP